MVSPECSAGAKCHCDGKTTTHVFLHKIIDSACLVTASWYRTYQADFFIPLHWRRNSFIKIATTPENMRYKLPDAKEATTTLCFIPSWKVWKVFKHMSKYKICREKWSWWWLSPSLVPADGYSWKSQAIFPQNWCTKTLRLLCAPFQAWLEPCYIRQVYFEIKLIWVAYFLFLVKQSMGCYGLPTIKGLNQLLNINIHHH